MKRATLMVGLAILALSNFAVATENESPQRFDGTQLWRVVKDAGSGELDDTDSLPEELENKYGGNVWRDNTMYLDVSIDKENLAAARTFLKRRKLQPEILNENIQSLVDDAAAMGANLTQEAGGLRSKRAARSGMHWLDYQDLETIYAYLFELRDQYPDICTLINIGKTENGRDLWVLRISENPTAYKKIWIDGGIHAREWISPATVTYIIQRIITNWSKMPDYIKQRTWFFMPVINPDGYVYSRTVNRLWRKNRSTTKGSECVGVDLNRNFDISWNGRGSSADPCSNTYRGSSPASELETQAVARFLIQQRDNLVAYLTYHSYSQAIVYPWAFMRELTSNYQELQRVGEDAAQRIKARTGMDYRVSVTHQTFGVAGGGSDDWTRATLNTPYVFTIEMRDRGQYGFLLPPDQILDAAGEGLIVALTVANAAA